MLTRPSQIEKRREIKPCLICGGQQGRVLYHYHHAHGISDILCCLGCGHLLISPIPLSDIHSREMDLSRDNMAGRSFMGFLKKKLIVEREISLVNKFIVGNKNKLLDIGCGNGWITHIWQQHGFQVVGLEPSPPNRQVCQERYGFPVLDIPAESLTHSEQFDIITLRHLLEHIEHPQKLLEKIHQALKPDGLLLLTSPNIDSLGRYLFGANWIWGLPHHVHFFRPKPLTLLLRNHGFKILCSYQSASPLYFLWAMLKTFERHPSVCRCLRFLRYPILILLTPWLWLSAVLGHGDNITVICRKGPADV